MTPALTPQDMAAIHAASFTLPPPWAAAEIAATLASPGAFVLREDQGFLIGRVILDEAELLTLAVAPAARRHGIGARLLAAFHARARDLGALSAFLEVAAGNAPAQALYRGAGWAQAGRRARYYHSADGQQHDDALILRRAL